ncbi:MAG: 2Fe-2S iron-sulfur cluster-binding protein [Nocardioides sp.]
MPEVRIEPSGFTAHLLEGEPILAGLTRCGFTVRKIGCRRGGCGICKIELVAGEVDYVKVVADTVLTADERAAGTALTCRAVPLGDVVLHIDEQEIDAAPPGLLRYLNLAPAPPGKSSGHDPQGRPQESAVGSAPRPTAPPTRHDSTKGD